MSSSPCWPGVGGQRPFLGISGQPRAGSLRIRMVGGKLGVLGPESLVPAAQTSGGLVSKTFSYRFLNGEGFLEYPPGDLFGLLGSRAVYGRLAGRPSQPGPGCRSRMCGGHWAHRQPELVPSLPPATPTQPWASVPGHEAHVLGPSLVLGTRGAPAPLHTRGEPHTQQAEQCSPSL